MGHSIFINHTEFPYHVTARCINREWFSLDMHVVWGVMVRHLYFVNFAFNLRIHAFVLMSNHFHMIVRTPDANLSEAMAYFMRETSRELTKLGNRENQTYGGRFHRSLLNSPLYYLHAYKYLYRNPVTAGTSKRVEDYPFSSLQGLLGETWLEVPIAEDDRWGSLSSRESTLAWLNFAPAADQWEEVRKALKKAEFTLSPQNNHPSILEVNAL